MSSYGTRRNSAIQSPQVAASPLPISAAAPYSPQVYAAAGSPLLATSLGKQKRPVMAPAKSGARRLSTSTQAQLRPGALSQSVPASLISAGSRARSSSVSQGQGLAHAHAHSHAGDELVDGNMLDHAVPAKGKRKDKGQTYECEKCSKVYRHSTCLTKHRWEHTEHWKEASKLLLSKHQQVQLLEGAAILAAASAGSSLPDEKSFWPAAVSPPTSGLLGAAQGIHSLSFGSPRWGPSSLISDVGDYDRSELDDIESDDEDDMSPEPRSGSAEEDQEMENGMFELDLEGSGELPPPSPLPIQHARLISGVRGSPSAGSDSSSSRASSTTRPGMRSSDSGFGSVGRGNNLFKVAAQLSGAAGVVLAGNSLGVTGATPPTSLLASQQQQHLHPHQHQHNQAAHAVQGFFVLDQQQQQQQQ
ncbi:hypothetical protein JCM3775_001195 [Rhodotorula graminis]